LPTTANHGRPITDGQSRPIRPAARQPGSSVNSGELFNRSRPEKKALQSAPPFENFFKIASGKSPREIHLGKNVRTQIRESNFAYLRHLDHANWITQFLSGELSAPGEVTNRNSRPAIKITRKRGETNQK
jgi:hypothetical protein